MKNSEHVVIGVVEKSIADKMEIKVGDRLVSINQTEVQDVFDYHYLCNEEKLHLVIENPDGQIRELEIEKEYDEDLGIEFDTGLMDEYKSCSNKCIFCFIDQMPKGMRETLYFKDDDSRLSFLQGNYITLTNMNQKDIDRIVNYKMGPINISVQTMNPQLRCEMLHNRFAGEALQKMDQFLEAKVPMNGQIVLCKGVNDGKELEFSLKELLRFAPVMESVSVVPVGLSKFREGLFPLESFQQEEAIQVLDLIHQYQQLAVEKCGMHFVHASDEWYLLAQRPLPEEDNYDGYLQLENGVGMLTLLRNEVRQALVKNKIKKPWFKKKRKVTIATGCLVESFIRELAREVEKEFSYLTVEVISIVNEFFGPMITVSGLITGTDLINQLKNRALGDELLLPINMLRNGERVFLDDISVEQVENALAIKIRIVDSPGLDFVSAIVG